MKFWEYIWAQGISKIFDNIQREEEQDKRQWLKSQERKLDKGSWVYNHYEECFDLVPPKKNPHFVTDQEDGNILTVIISKKPHSLESEQFDYPWEAEDFCENYYANKLEYYDNVIIKRDAPILIADDDIACPYCKNSRPPVNWIKNSFEQELQEVPADVFKYRNHSADQLQLDDYYMNYYWCPICSCQVKADYLMKKGDEWKIQFLKDKKIPNRMSPLLIKNRHERKERKETEEWEGPRGLQARIDNPDRPLLPFNPSLITPEYHQGLMVRAVIKVDTKSQEIHKAKWIKASCGIPEAATIDIEVTSYFHNDGQRVYMERRYRQFFPLRYYPIHEIVINKAYYTRNAATIEALTKSYHRGEPLPFVSINTQREAMEYLDVIEFAIAMGFTHVPAIICGSPKVKKEMEDKYKEEVTIFTK